MTRMRSTEERSEGESISDDDFRRCVTAAVDESLRNDITLAELLEATRRKMKGARQ